MYSIQQLLNGLRNPELATEEVLRQLANLHPPIGRTTFDFYAKRTHTTDFEEFDNPPDPFKPRYVDPASIESFTGRRWPPWKNEKDMLGKVLDGNWDRTNPTFREDYGEEYRPIYKLFRTGRFSETPFFKSFESHFIHNVDWEDTQFVRQAIKIAKQDLPSWKGYTSKEKILSHCEKVDDLYETIRNEGYMSQLELKDDYDPRWAAKEVTVDIGRDGELLFVNGRHRLTLAKILDLDTIPVGIQVRHKGWMEKREMYCDKDRTLTHADVQNK